MMFMRPVKQGDRFVYLAVLLLIAFLDQLTKYVIERKLPLYGCVKAFGPVRLTHVRNQGAAFGLFHGSSLVLAASGLVFLGVLALLWVADLKNRGMRWGLVLLASGCTGNLIDRVVRGAVIDFVDLGFWPVFNLADVFIVVGLLLILCALFPDAGVVGQAVRVSQDKSESEKGC